MGYPKPALTIDEQINKLTARGLIIHDLSHTKLMLENVNFHRLSLYFPFYLRLNSIQFIENTTFDDLWDLYVFDRQLRLLTLDLIERFEISLRTKIINSHSIEYGALGYTLKQNLPNMNSRDHADFLSKILQKQSITQDDFVKQNNNDYPEEVFLPFWKAGELMDFGNISRFYEGMDYNLSDKIANYYQVHKKVLPKWIRTISYTRNLCAHHQRLWNRVLAIKPEIPRETIWETPVVIGKERYFAIITILRYLQKIISPQSKWKTRFINMLNEERFKDIPKAEMGFPDNWLKSPIWED